MIELFNILLYMNQMISSSLIRFLMQYIWTIDVAIMTKSSAPVNPSISVWWR